MDETHMSEGDNKRRQTSDLIENSNTNDGPESAKLLKTENGSVALETAIKFANGVRESTSTANINETLTPEVNDNHTNLPNMSVREQAIAAVLREFRNVTSDDDNSLSTVYENRPISPELFSDDEDFRHSTPLLNKCDSEEDVDEHPVLKKAKPSHNWFMVSEVISRQYGYCSKKNGPELFQRRCYGSLHCAQRLELKYKLDKHEGCVNSLDFNQSGTLLASGSDDLNVIVWDWQVGKPLLDYDSKHRSNVLQSKFLDLSGDLQLATCSRDGQIRLSQVSVLEGLRSNRKLGTHKGACNKLAILYGQSHIILSAGEDGIVYHHDIRQNKPEKLLDVVIDNGTVALYSINAHPLNPYEFCVAGRDTHVRSYDQRMCGENAKPLLTYFPSETLDSSDDISTHVTCAIYNHNGSEILASYNDDDIYLFDVNGTPGTFVHRYQGHRNGATIKGVNFFGPKSEFIISGSDCGNVYIWEKNTEAIVNWMMADDNGVTNCLEPHPQLPFLCTSGLEWDIKVWVPSSVDEPIMRGLPKTVRSNLKSRNDMYRSGMGENRILWMLFRHFRTQRRSYSMGDDQSTRSSLSSTNSDTTTEPLEDISDCTPS